MILAIDPGSVRTGYAVLDENHRIADAGILRPNVAKKPANDRIIDMVDELPGLIQEHGITQAVIEDTSGKVAGRLAGRAIHGLAIHGKAVGWFIAECRRLLGPGNVHCVLENVWTAGTSKMTRQRWIAAQWTGYEALRDRGADAADAIGLALWWGERVHKGAFGEVPIRALRSLTA